MFNRNLMFSSKTDNWRTPTDMLRALNQEFPFDFDPCPYVDADDDRAQNGLNIDWEGKCIFVNPPYNRKYSKLWVKKGLDESRKGKTVVMLLPARTDTKYFHDFVLPNAEIRFIRGRLKFSGHHNPAPFPSMLAIFHGDPKREISYQYQLNHN
jgi:phage N-6-adenine-methyltransferase